KGTIAKVVNKATRKAVVTVKSVSGAKGYQIRYATVSNMKGAKTVTLSASTLSRTFKSLKKGKTYYFQVRAYKTDSTGKKIYGSWSAKKSVKIKK
ncbi:MAG: fibronectin type III domain-containing protein, partial [Agathobacter sp.]|uniref:fibronectin type III domain-containing protein n=1 Tax=Agathobacter sp. TaxID=2021311 RepID=UPI00257CC2F3